MHARLRSAGYNAAMGQNRERRAFLPCALALAAVLPAQDREQARILASLVDGDTGVATTTDDSHAGRARASALMTLALLATGHDSGNGPSDVRAAIHKSTNWLQLLRANSRAEPTMPLGDHAIAAFAVAQTALRSGSVGSVSMWAHAKAQAESLHAEVRRGDFAVQEIPWIALATVSTRIFDLEEQEELERAFAKNARRRHREAGGQPDLTDATGAFLAQALFADKCPTEADAILVRWQRTRTNWLALYWTDQAFAALERKPGHEAQVAKWRAMRATLTRPKEGPDVSTWEKSAGTGATFALRTLLRDGMRPRPWLHPVPLSVTAQLLESDGKTPVPGIPVVWRRASGRGYPNYRVTDEDGEARLWLPPVDSIQLGTAQELRRGRRGRVVGVRKPTWLEKLDVAPDAKGLRTTLVLKD